MWLSHTRGRAQTHGRREAERGRHPAVGSARGSGHARAFRRASQMRQGPDRGDRPSGPGHGRTRRVANSAPADGEWDEAGQHRQPDKHGACDRHGERVTSRLRPCRTSVSGRRNARAHRGRRSSCTLRNGGLSIGNLGHLPDPPLWRVEEWRKRRDISLPGDDSIGRSEPTVGYRRWDCRSARCNPLQRPWFGSRQSHVGLSSA